MDFNKRTLAKPFQKMASESDEERARRGTDGSLERGSGKNAAPRQAGGKAPDGGKASGDGKASGGGKASNGGAGRGPAGMLAGALRQFSPRCAAKIALGMAIATLGVYSIHRRCAVTEGGVIGLVLLLDHHLGVPPWALTAVLDAACYALGWRVLGGGFLLRSAFATLCGAVFFRVWALLPPLLPDLSARPLAAALLGGAFVGLGGGLVVRQGGSGGGDDALALVIARKTGWRISRAYLLTDLTVLLLSLTYIAPRRIAWSLLTVTVSSLLIDLVKSAGRIAKCEKP